MRQGGNPRTSCGTGVGQQEEALTSGCLVSKRVLNANRISVRVLAALTLLLLTGVPYALTRPPFPLGMVGPVEAAHPISELTTRLALSGVALAMAALAVAIALLATALALVPNAARQFLWSVWSLASVAYALGFGCYPVWLNGVMTASTRELVNDLDPKHVAPFVWFRCWFDYPQWPLTFGMFAIILFTPFISWRVIIGLKQKQFSWNLAMEAALPLGWICLHRPMLYAFAWSFD
jgi:hypothetical protein